MYRLQVNCLFLFEYCGGKKNGKIIEFCLVLVIAMQFLCLFFFCMPEVIYEQSQEIENLFYFYLVWLKFLFKTKLLRVELSVTVCDASILQNEIRVNTAIFFNIIESNTKYFEVIMCQFVC